MPPTASARRPLIVALALAGLLVLGPAAPAAADPPAPTDFLSEVVAVEPAAPGVAISVVGGDGFLLLAVPAGRTAEVPGYSGEPYLRFGADGTVEENVASAASYLNMSRDRTDLDRAYDPGAPPLWRVVATDGRWAWHDHRIHHMGGPLAADARTPRGVSWTVPIVVDGEEVAVHGRYRLLDGPAPWPWLLGGALLAAGLVAAGRGRGGLTVIGVALLGAGGLAVVAAVGQRAASPPGAPTSPLVVILPALGVVAAAIALVQRGRVVRGVAALAAAATVAGWAGLRVAVLWRAVIPTEGSARVDRLATAAGLAVAVAAATVVIRSGALAPPAPPAAPPRR